MKIEITYIFHDCFVVKLNEKAFLFDYPADEYLNENMRNTLTTKIKDSDLYVFTSHNHEDHFNRNITNLSTYPQNVTYIFSKNIIKKTRKLKAWPASIIVAPDSPTRSIIWRS